MKRFFTSLKLLKYSDGYITYILLSILSFLAGSYALFVLDSPIYGCLCITLAPIIIGHMSSSLTMTESIAASPYRKNLSVVIPNVMTCLGGLIAFACLYITLNIKADRASMFYTLSEADAICRFYYEGILIIFATSICMAIAVKRPAGIFVLILLVLFKDFIVSLYGYNVLYYNVNGLELNTALMHIIGVITLLIGLFISCEWRNRLDNTPFLYLLQKANSKNIMSKGRLPIVAATCIACALIGIGVYTFLDSKEPDGWYDKEHMKAKLQSLLQDCGETIEFEEFTVCIEKQYYDSVSGDACCLISFHDNEGYGTSFAYSEYGNSISIYTSNHTHYSAIIDGDGITDVDAVSAYEIFLSDEYVINRNYPMQFYIYMNMLPLNENDTLSIYFLDHTTFDSVSYVENGNRLYGSRFDENYTEDVWKKYTFTDTGHRKTIDSSGIQITASDYSLTMHKYIDFDNLSLIMEDDEEIAVIKDSKLIEGFEHLENNYIVKYSLDNVIDPTKVVDIVWEGDIIPKSPYVNTSYALYETYTMRHTIRTEHIDERNADFRVNLDIEWTQMPKYRKTDYVYLYYNYSMNSFRDDIHITQSVYEHITNITNNGQLITATLPSYTHIPIKQNTIIHEITLHEDSSSRTYTNETISIELCPYIQGDGMKNPTILWSYTHHKNNTRNDTFIHDEEYTENYGLIGCPFYFRLWPEEKTFE